MWGITSSDGGVQVPAGVPPDYSSRIKLLRARLGLTQVRLAELMGVSFASVNRWENAQSKPSALAWRKITEAEQFGVDALKPGQATVLKETPVEYSPQADKPFHLDFSSDPEVVRAVVEGHRLSYGHLFNPAFATETSLIDPLPHQRIAVYDRMLGQPRLRFLLADDAGAGKTIMTGLYIREMMARRLIRRVLIVPPAGLVGNWERELRTLFGLSFAIVSGQDCRSGNPFAGDSGNLVIVSVDTLLGDRPFARLRESAVAPYDLVVFDEAHKLSADREPDFRVRRTHRYELAEALAGVPGLDERWELNWAANHLLLLTATPHMGKDYPYYALWRLLAPESLPTLDAFNAYPADARRRHFIRRTKEEMVYLDGKPIYPTRVSDTLSYDLSQGPVSEQALYDATSAYIEHYYNRARILNRSAVRLAMSVFQRRLASSTYALLRSMERRLEKLESIIEAIKSGKITIDQLRRMQQGLDAMEDVFDEKTAEEETPEDGQEEAERFEDEAVGGVVATSLAELEAERRQVESILALARKVYDRGEESKFEKLKEVLTDPRYKDQKLIIFTEHRDTLTFLVRRLEGLGFAGQIAQIHGGLDYGKRDEQVAFFRRPVSEGGAVILAATDAAGEGINLQFCWLMVNYDVPWNPARLEQRMGRIHRYLQKHDPVIILNLVAGKTREGKVLGTLLEKLEKIRKELGSDKVFDVVGRLFEGVSLRAYMEMAVTEKGAEEAANKIEGKLTKEQVEALRERERRLFGDGGDVKVALPEMRRKMEEEELRRLMPGYVRRFVEHTAPLMHIAIEGDLGGTFTFKPLRPGALDPLWPVLEEYPAQRRDRLTVLKPRNGDTAIFLHPGEALFDRFRALVCARFALAAQRGGVFVDPYASKPYLFHLALVSTVRQPDEAFPGLSRPENLEWRLAGLRQEEDGKVQTCPVEQLLLLKGAPDRPPIASSFVDRGDRLMESASDQFSGLVTAPMVESRRQVLQAGLAERLDFVARGYDYQDAELAAARARLYEKAQNVDPRAKAELARIKERQRSLAARRDQALASLRREPELVAAGEVNFLAAALVVPSSDPEDVKRHDREVEDVAVRLAWAHEDGQGANVRDVSTPQRAVAEGLGERPGFDLLSRRPSGEELAIEVKGRVGIGDVELTENEWVKACNLRDRYWLYVVYDCGTPHPRLLRVKDPFGSLLVKALGGVLVDEHAVFQAAEED